MRKTLCDVISLRTILQEGMVDRVSEIKQAIRSKIDLGNAILGLDIIVRDGDGRPISSDLSTIDIFRFHDAAIKRSKLLKIGSIPADRNPEVPKSACLNYNLLVRLENFVCRVGDDADLVMSLYDGKQINVMSENYIVKWAKEGLVKDLDQLNNLSVVFTDLGTRDLQRDKIFFVCQVIRIGGMDIRETVESVQRTKTVNPSKKYSEGIRRPFGVAAMEITDIITEKICIEEKIFIPFIPCEEGEFLESIVKKFVNQKGNETMTRYRDQGIHVSFRMIQGDYKEIVDEGLVPADIPVARKMGFPEVILPGDVRNDLYLTLITGEFNSKIAKNVEVTVKVCNEKGETVRDVVSSGAGSDFCNEYKSVVYYHEERPKWIETLRIAIPIESFYESHLKFLFKNRSSSESKDKNEKPVALAFIRLKNPNDTAISDQIHKLVLYKISSKKFYESDANHYLNLPSTKAELDSRNDTLSQGMNQKINSSNYSIPGLTLLTKDCMYISTVICSTKLTQNVDLLCLLALVPNSASDDEIKKCLSALLKVDGEEIVKFLQDTLDALFKIFIERNSDEFNDLFLQVLIRIIGLISDPKYEHFRPVLDGYISDNFSWTLAYEKLIGVLKRHVDQLIKNGNLIAASEEERAIRKSSLTHIMLYNDGISLQMMQSLEYLFKLIVKSRSLFASLEGGKGRVQFEVSLKELLSSFVRLMGSDGHEILKVQAKCLKFFPQAIPDLLTVLDGKELCWFLTELINNIPLDKLKPQKILCISDIINTECLFRRSDCRQILLPVFNDHIRLLLEKKEQLDICLKVLSDILMVLDSGDVGSTREDISDIMLSILRTIIQTVVHMDRTDSLVGNLVAIMLSKFNLTLN